MYDIKTTPINRVSAFFAPPKSPDEEKSRVASLLNFITLIYIVIALFSTLTVLAFGAQDPGRHLTELGVRLVPYILMLIIVQVAIRRDHVFGAARFFVAFYWLTVTLDIWTNGGVSSPSFASYLIAVLIAGLFLGVRMAALVGALSVAAGAMIAYQQSNNQLPPPITQPGPITDVISITISIIIVLGLLYLYISHLEQALKALRHANHDLQRAGLILEQQVQERTRALATSIDVSRRLSTLLDPQQLVTEAVQELQSAFGYAHVHLYLVDAEQQALRIAAGTGDAGRAMLSRRQQVALGQGLVGQAAETRQPAQTDDITLEPGWQPNLLLPDVHSEAAIPIQAGDALLGVLDVHQNQTGAFRDQDVELLQSIANQIAVALQNANAYIASRRHAQREAFVAGLSQKIQNTRTIDEVLQVAVTELGQNLGAQRASVELRSPDQQRAALTDSE